MPRIDEQKDYYNSRWANQEYINPFALQRLIAILEMLNDTDLEKPKILDLGCGTGWLTAILNEFGPTTGIELAPKAVEAAKYKYPAAEFLAGNVFELELPEKKYDIVISQEVIEHVDDQETYLKIATSFLRTGGYLILTTPNAYNLNHWTKEALVHWDLQPIENWLTMREVKRLLEKRFCVLKSMTIIDEFGTKGPYKVLSSVKINKILDVLKLKAFKNKLALRLGLGLHIVLLARKVIY